MTIRGAKKILKLKGPLKFDELSNNSIKVTNVKKIIKIIKINKRYKILNKMAKNSYKSSFSSRKQT